MNPVSQVPAFNDNEFYLPECDGLPNIYVKNIINLVDCIQKILKNEFKSTEC